MSVLPKEGLYDDMFCGFFQNEKLIYSTPI